MNADPIARGYRFLEYATFGNLLWRTRTHYIDQLKDKHRILIAGEGDGRFLAALLNLNSQAQIDLYDNSAKMIELAKTRTKQHAHRLTFHQADLLKTEFPTNTYDAVVANFIFDCFNNDELTQLISKLKQSTAPDAIWLIGDFAIPASGLSRWTAMLLTKLLYAVFAITTELKTRNLPDYETLLWNAGLRRIDRYGRLAHLLTAQTWT